MHEISPFVGVRRRAALLLINYNGHPKEFNALDSIDLIGLMLVEMVFLGRDDEEGSRRDEGWGYIYFDAYAKAVTLAKAGTEVL